MKRFVYRLLLSFLIAFFLAACASLPSTPNPNTPPNIPNTSPNTLEPDAVFEDESGLVLAASAESLKETIGISISSSSENPKAELAEGLSVVGEFFVIESSADLRLGSSPFGAGLPVPESANVERLKVAVWASLDEAVSLHEQEGWQLLSGVYDASRSLFLVPHYAFSEASNVYVLVEDALGQKVTVSPTASTELNTQAITPDFVFNCRLSCFDSNFQPKSFVNDIAQFLSDSYLEFLSLGFKKPAIQEEITGFDWGSLSFTYKDVFEVDLKAIFTTPNKSEPTEDCESTGSITNLGVYKPSSRLIVICIDTANGNSFSEDTVRHEYFHATQYAYSAMRNTWAKRWFSMVEGTATLAGSSPTGGLARDNRTLMPVDVPLLSFSDTKLYQYRSQDFYYFLADQFNQSDVGFLKNFLAKGAGSSEISQAIASFNDTELTNLKTAYWAWAQNQALVKSFNPNSFLGTSCKLEPAVATPSSMRFYANESVLSRESSQQVAPLSSKLIAFTFDEQIGSYTADLRIDTSGTTGLKVMFVDPDDCSSAAEQSSFSVSVPVNTSKVIYALVSNNEYGGSTQSFKAKHDIQFDGLDLSIDQPTATNFDEDDTIPLQASLNNVDSSKYLIKWSYDDNGTEIVLASTRSGERKNINLCDGIYDINVLAFAPSEGIGNLTKSFRINVSDLGASNPPAACAPQVNITSPSEGTSFALGSSITFNAAISDDKKDTDDPIYPVIWRLGGPDGLIIARDTLSFSRDKFSAGEQIIYVEYGSASDQISINLIDTSNTAPTVNISSPQDGTSLFWNDYYDGSDGTNIPLQGSATDTEDGRLTGSNLAWSYRIKGASTWLNIDVGSTAVLNLRLVSPSRTYEVRLKANDKGSPSLEGEDIIEFTIIGPPS